MTKPTQASLSVIARTDAAPPPRVITPGVWHTPAPAPLALKITPAMVVPVLVKPGPVIPRASKNSFRLHKSKEKPPACDILPAGSPG